jgi:hypothetical protein
MINAASGSILNVLYIVLITFFVLTVLGYVFISSLLNNSFKHIILYTIFLFGVVAFGCYYCFEFLLFMTNHTDSSELSNFRFSLFMALILLAETAFFNLGIVLGMRKKL